MYWPLSSPLKAFWAVGVNGFPHRYQRGSIRSIKEPIRRVDIFINKSGTAEVSFRLLQKETEAFFVARHHQQRDTKTRRIIP